MPSPSWIVTTESVGALTDRLLAAANAVRVLDRHDGVRWAFARQSPSPDYSLDKWAGRLVLGARSRRHDASAAVFLQ